MISNINKQTWIALAAMVATIAIFAIVRGGSSDEAPSFEIEAVSNLERIEIVPPAGSDGPELIVLERRDQGRWWMRRPVEDRLDWQVAEQFELTFAKSIGTDDLIIESDRLDSYDLNEEKSVMLALFSAGSDRPDQEIIVGREFQVPQTGALRTFIKEPGNDVIYRAQAGFGELVRRSVGELRDRTILSVGDEGMEAVKIRHRDGHQVEIERRDERWQFPDEPAADIGLDPQSAQRLVSTVGRLDASGFAEDDAESVGLDAPDVVIEVITGDDEVRLEVSRHSADEETHFYVRREGEEFIYEVEDSIGQILIARLDDVRDRRIIGAGSSAIDEIFLAGETAVQLVRDGQEWIMLLPTMQPVDQQRVTRLAEFLGGLRVERWADDISAEEAGLEAEDRRRVVIGVGDDATTLELGSRVDRTRGSHYARYSEAEPIFVLSRSAVERLTAGADDFAVQ